MGFYRQISKYYDYIFPTGKEQLEFISKAAGSPPKRIMDVACGTGGYSAELAKRGHSIWAVDLDDEMVEKAEEKARQQGANIVVLKSDMRELAARINNKFDCIFCIGNSLVHLGNSNEIAVALNQMNKLLDKDGILVLQIINYDRIIKNELTGLPIIKNNEIGMEFIREYEYIKEKNLINFNTILTIHNNKTRERYKNSIELFPILSNELKRLLEESGFGNIQFYGDFNYSRYDENSYMLVATAVK